MANKLLTEDEVSEISLPVKADNTPDFAFMERYIKSLPYSRFF